MVDDEKDQEEYEKDSDSRDSNNIEIWEDEMDMLVLNGNQLLVKCEDEEKSKVGKRNVALLLEQ